MATPGIQPQMVSKKNGILLPPNRIMLIGAVFGIAFINAAFLVTSKIALAVFPPFALSLTRFACATLILLPAVLLFTRVRLESWICVKLGIFGFMISICGVLQSFALQWISANIAGIIIATTPLWSTIVGVLLLGMRPNLKQLIGIATGIAGIVMLQGSLEGSMELKGLALMVATVVVWSLNGIWGNKERFPTSVAAIAFQNLGGVVGLSIVCMFTDNTLRSELNLFAVGAIGFQVLFNSIFLLMLFTYLLRNSTPAFANSFVYLVPSFTALLSMFVFSEVPSLVQIGAMILAVVAVALILPKPSFRSSRCEIS